MQKKNGIHDEYLVKWGEMEHGNIQGIGDRG